MKPKTLVFRQRKVIDLRTSDKKAPTQHNANRLVLANKFHTCVLIWLITDFLFDVADSIVSIFTGSIFAFQSFFSLSLLCRWTLTCIRIDQIINSTINAIDRWQIPLAHEYLYLVFFWYCFRLNCLLFGFAFSLSYVCGVFTLNRSRYFATALLMMVAVVVVVMMMTIIAMIECRGNASACFQHNYCWSESISVRWLISFCFSLFLVLMFAVALFILLFFFFKYSHIHNPSLIAAAFWYFSSVLRFFRLCAVFINTWPHE